MTTLGCTGYIKSISITIFENLRKIKKLGVNGYIVSKMIDKLNKKLQHY